MRPTAKTIARFGPRGGPAAITLWGFLFLAISPQQASAQVGGGSGTGDDPYLISTPQHLQDLADSNSAGDWDKHFKLTADLDLTGLPMTPIGDLATPFSGAFNGGGHTVANLTIILPATHYVGLFGVVDSAFDPTIFNLGLNNSHITGVGNIGALAGRLINTAISDCYATGPVTGTAGGVGGLVGNNSATITDSYAAGAVSGGSSLGGLVGRFNGDTISNCYAVGRVAGFVSDGGGLVGENIAGTITNSFWDTQTSGQASSGGGMGKTTAQMKQQATFTGWDFIEPWGIFENQTYPLLKANAYYNTAKRKKYERNKATEIIVLGNNLDRYKHHWRDSLNGMGNCCHLGVIPVESITRLSLL